MNKKQDDDQISIGQFQSKGLPARIITFLLVILPTLVLIFFLSDFKLRTALTNRIYKIIINEKPPPKHERSSSLVHPRNTVPQKLVPRKVSTSPSPVVQKSSPKSASKEVLKRNILLKKISKKEKNRTKIYKYKCSKIYTFKGGIFAQALVQNQRKMKIPLHKVKKIKQGVKQFVRKIRRASQQIHQKTGIQISTRMYIVGKSRVTGHTDSTGWTVCKIRYALENGNYGEVEACNERKNEKRALLRARVISEIVASELPLDIFPDPPEVTTRLHEQRGPQFRGASVYLEVVFSTKKPISVKQERYISSLIEKVMIT